MSVGDDITEERQEEDATENGTLFMKTAKEKAAKMMNVKA